MEKIQAGSGSYGFTYEIQVEKRNGKKEWVKYTFWFEGPGPRDVVMNRTKANMPNARKWKRVGK